MAGKKFVKVTGLGTVLVPETINISAGTASLKSGLSGNVIDENSILFIVANASDAAIAAEGSKWIFAKGMLFNAQNAQFEKLANFTKATGAELGITSTDTVVTAFGKIQAHFEKLDAEAVKNISVGQGLDVQPDAGTGNTITISHDNSAASASAGTSVGDGTHVAQVAIDSMGHVTAITSVEITHKTEDTGKSETLTAVTSTTDSDTTRVSAVTSVVVDQFGHVREVSGKELGEAANHGVVTAINDTTKTSASLPTTEAVHTFVKAEVADLTGAMHFIGTTEIEIKDGSNTKPTDLYTGSTTMKAGDIVIYGKKEFVWTKSGAWAELGDVDPKLEVTSLEGLTGAINVEGANGVTISSGSTVENGTITIGIAENTYDAYGAASDVKTALEGTASDTSASTTIAGAKKYADEVAADARETAISSGKSYTDQIHTQINGTSEDTSAATTIAGAKKYAKDYADSLAPNYATAAQGTKADSALQSVSAAGSGFVNASASEKADNTQAISVSLDMQSVATADADNQGLAEASDVKQYVDTKVTGTFSPIDAAASDWGEYPAPSQTA